MAGPIRVAMLTHGFLPDVGGAERQLASLVPLLAERGVEARVVTRRRPELAARETLAGVDITRIDVGSRKGLASVRYVAGVSRELRRRPVDIVHAHSLLSPSTAAVVAGRVVGVPAVAKILRGGTLGDLTDLRRKGRGELRFRLLDRQLDGYLVISEEIEAELIERGVDADRRWFIPNGVDTGRFARPSAVERARLRAELGLDGVVAVFAGRLAPEKRLDALLSVWPSVRAAQPEARLVVLGEGPEEERLRSMAPDGVVFVGPVDDVAPYLAAADAFVLPSAAEGLSNALLEAMAAGLGCVATSVGGAVELLGGGAGWLVEPGADNDLAAALIELMTDHEARARAGGRAAAVVAERYSIDQTAHRLADLYASLLEGY